MTDRWGRRALAMLSLAASSLVLLLAAGAATAADPVLSTERDRVSYLVASDIARDISQVGPDLDFAAFEKDVRPGEYRHHFGNSHESPPSAARPDRFQYSVTTQNGKK